MSKTIIGISPDNGSLKTNLPTSEKFTCQAIKDYNKKKEEERKRIRGEIERRADN